MFPRLLHICLLKVIDGELQLFRQSDEFSGDELRSATVRLAQLDLALKGGSRLAPDLELQRALLDLSRERGPAESR